MRYQIIAMAKACTIALSALWAAASTASAQPGAQTPYVPRGVNPYGAYSDAWQFYNNPSSGAGAPLMNPPTFMTSLQYPGVYGAYILGPGGGFFPAPGPHTNGYTGIDVEPIVPDDLRAHINVVVPATARVWFNDVGTRQRGRYREFVSTELNPGLPYHYDIRASWINGQGREVTATRSVTVAAGDWLNVDLLAPPRNEMHATPLPEVEAPRPATSEKPYSARMRGSLPPAQSAPQRTVPVP